MSGEQACALYDGRDLRRGGGLAPPISRFQRLDRGEPDSREPAHGLCAGGMRSWFSDSGRQHRSLLPHVRVLSSRVSAGSALERSRDPDCLASRCGGDFGTRSHLRRPGSIAEDVMQDLERLRRSEIGQELHDFAAELYPICRSITGGGIRQTLARIQQRIPLQITEVPTGTRVFDWTVPKEWNIRDAYVKNSDGIKVIDFKKSTLHVLNYSTPIHKRISLAELREHLYTLPDHPDWIPYKTSYYQERWGFCLTQNQLDDLEDGSYEVVIDSSLETGNLTYAECLIPGGSPDEVLISCHICHPSICNDNLSGIALNTFLAKHLHGRPLRYSYRFIFVPGTIGAITWLALNENATYKIKHGLVVANVGDSGKMNYKKSRRGDAEIDRAVAHALKDSGSPYEITDFSPYGYDERQFCSPG